MTIEKKSLINNLKTTKKAIVASAPTEAKVSARVLPRKGLRLRAKVGNPMRAHISIA